MKLFSRILIAFLMLPVFLAAQTTPLNLSAGGKSWKFFKKIVVTKLSCDHADTALVDTSSLASGEVATCTITISSPAPPGGFPIVPFSADTGLSIGPTGLTVPAGATQTQFQVMMQ